jgi:hypothetical protein
MAVGLGLTGMLLSSTAQAAGIPITLTTTPVSLDLHIAPGTQTSSTLQFKNSSSVALPVNMQVQVFGAYGSSGQAAITKPKPSDPSTSWVSFSPSSFTAQPNVWTAVKMTINLPKTASLGYYYAVIFKPTIPTTTPQARSTSVKGSNAILVLVDSASGNEKKSISVANFSANKHVYEYLPVNFSVTLHNSGNIYLAPSGDIFISRNSDISKTIATIPFNPGGANILPDSNRIFNSSWSDGFPVYKQKIVNGQPAVNSKGQPVYNLQWNFSSSLSKLRFGKYYAQLAVTYNDGKNNKLLNSRISFWVIPWPLLIGLLIIIIVLIKQFWSTGRNIYRKAVGRVKKGYKKV